MRRRADKLDHCVFYTNTAVGYGTAGRPDIDFYYSGRMVVIETKVGKNGLSPIQKVQHRKMKRAGTNPRVVRSLAEFDEIIKEMENHDRPR